MMPGNQHMNAKVPNHTKRLTLKDERTVSIYIFCDKPFYLSSGRKVFLFLQKFAHFTKGENQ